MIDYHILMTTFGMVFLAELGDKTQLATFCLAADCDPKLSVFIGAGAALLLSTLIAVIFGSVLSKFIPEHYIKVAAGIFFVVVGIWMLTNAAKAFAA